MWSWGKISLPIRFLISSLIDLLSRSNRPQLARALRKSICLPKNLYSTRVDLAYACCADLSHGIRKRFARASALLPGPRLLFLDEPFEGIDAVASRQIKDLLHKFVSGGGTIFLTSHILEIVDKLANHVGVIQKGKLVAQGSMSELRADSGGGKGLEQIFLELVGADGDNAVSLDWLGG